MLDKKLSVGEVLGNVVRPCAASIEAAMSAAVGSDARQTLGDEPAVQLVDLASTGATATIDHRRNDVATNPRFNTAPP